VKGFGLGLNYVDSIVKLHGGEITVESAANKGSTFKIKIEK
jgi:two-component system phosphate regulon sensor histidine kinase PhoR